jgi:hypothetical protein
MFDTPSTRTALDRVMSELEAFAARHPNFFA